MVAHTVYRTIETKRKQTKRTRGDDDDNDDDARGAGEGKRGEQAWGPRLNSDAGAWHCRRDETQLAVWSLDQDGSPG